MHAHDVPAWAGGSAHQKPADNPFRAATPDGANPFAAAAQQPVPLWVPARPEGTHNPFATSSVGDNPFATSSVGEAPPPITTVPTSKQAAPATRPSPPPSRPWEGCCGITPWAGCIGCVCIGVTCSFAGATAYDYGYWEAFGVIYSVDAIASIGAMVPHHCRTPAPPHRRTAAPLHPLHPLHLLRATRSSYPGRIGRPGSTSAPPHPCTPCTTRSSYPARASTAAEPLPTGRSGQSSVSPTGSKHPLPPSPHRVAASATHLFPDSTTHISTTHGCRWFILLTIGLCFIPAKPYVIILCIVVQKLFWALNLAASCGCLGTAATASSTDKASGARAKTSPGQSTAGIELPVVSTLW